MRQQPETIGDAILLYVQQQHGTQANAAIAWHCSTTMLSEVIRGTRRPTERMLAAIGYWHVEAWLPQSVALPASALPMSTDGVQASDATEQSLGLYFEQAEAIRELLDKHAPNTSGNLQTRIAQVLTGAAEPQDCDTCAHSNKAGTVDPCQTCLICFDDEHGGRTINWEPAALGVGGKTE